MPVSTASVKALQDLKDNWLCNDDEQSNIFGSYDSDSARMLTINLKRCTGKSYCKSRVVIDQTLKGSFIITLANQVRFDDQSFG